MVKGSGCSTDAPMLSLNLADFITYKWTEQVSRRDCILSLIDRTCSIIFNTRQCPFENSEFTNLASQSQNATGWALQVLRSRVLWVSSSVDCVVDHTCFKKNIFLFIINEMKIKSLVLILFPLQWMNGMADKLHSISRWFWIRYRAVRSEELNI